MKTGFYPMKVKLKLFFKWGIDFEDAYEVTEQSDREVHYAYKEEIENGIRLKYCKEDFEEIEEKTFPARHWYANGPRPRCHTEHARRTKDKELPKDRKRPNIKIKKETISDTIKLIDESLQAEIHQKAKNTK